ncbi:YqjF family protein [Deinococcus cellulosilyticus]|uniref:DUF2071 domain-containing protein n=1 Tax=Deinococcus cellulosilyticus (strain DSM 18568 / NBRC 106333 / KACC 11606 / 5516J-15) TaxID=1223518 RepID=A0A511MXU1_DEIC1|nr:DUF2071 domain-containing protein [Deinococcus cellulosilyticus]GEM45425.1 hypothetical protein DC3_10600 [Deinococcus cellulosilyticus NBRC 106333 = KACC 11606]
MDFLKQTAHRPWPMPESPWLIYMEWENLLFLHYPVHPDVLLPHIPEGLTLETYGGFAWLSVVPFKMKNTRPRGLPAVPAVSDFLELNLRTYVTTEGKPGVFFFSLDAQNPLAVRGARLGFHLPYFDARMRWEIQQGRTRYLSTRTHNNATRGEFEASYQPVSPLPRPSKSSLDHWLTERYCLYSADSKGRIYRCNIHHLPWPLHAVQVREVKNTLGNLIGTRLFKAEYAHYSPHLAVVGWGLEQINKS